jgi:hypothetical protein
VYHVGLQEYARLEAGSGALEETHFYRCQGAVHRQPLTGELKKDKDQSNLKYRKTATDIDSEKADR